MKMTPRSLPLLLFAALLLLVASIGSGQTTTDQTGTDLTTTETTATETTETIEQTTTEQTTTYFEDDDEAQDGALACGVCGGIGLIFFVLPLLISIGIAWWIYKDATRRENPQAVLWAVLGFFFNIIGLIIYLIARPKGPPGMTPTVPPPAV
jgi:hypothetical protein